MSEITLPLSEHKDAKKLLELASDGTFSSNSVLLGTVVNAVEQVYGLTWVIRDGYTRDEVDAFVTELREVYI